MPWPPPTLLCALALALDVVAVVAFSTVTHPYKPWTFITQIWPHRHYKFGESTLDLCAAALVRALLFSVLLRLSSARRAAAQQALLAQPLNVDVPPPPRPRVSAKRATLLFRIGFGVTLTHTAAKALARLLQAGIDPSTGSLPDPTTPTEVWFWLAVAAAPTLALLELTFGAKAAAAAAKAAGGEGGEDGEAAGGGAGGTGKKGEGDPAAEVKKAYIKRTEPKEIRSIARMATMMR